MSNYPFLIIAVLFVLFTSCVNNQQTVDDALKNMAVEEFMEFETLFYESIDSKNRPVRSTVESQTVYKGKLKSPFDKTELYLFEYQSFEPHLKVVISKNENIEILNETFEAERELLFSDAFIAKLNSLIALEDSFDKNKLVELSEFMFNVYYNEEQPLKLESWRDILHDDEFPIPDTLKNKIHKFEKTEKPDKLKYSGFVWEATTRYLYEVDFLYFKETGKVDVNSVNLGAVGIGYITL